MNKKVWRKPEVRKISAGAAEGNTPPGQTDGPNNSRS